MYRKHTVLAIIVLFCLVAQGSNPAYTRRHYADQELLDARLVWLFQEHHILKIRREALQKVKSDFLPMQDHVIEGVATVDVQNKLVHTPLSNAKRITLSYDEFDIFICDKELYYRAAEAFIPDSKSSEK